MEKAEFESYRALALEVRLLRQRLTTLESSMYSPKGQRFTSTPHAKSSAGKTMDDIVAKHIALETLYQESLAEKEAQLLRVSSAIDSLSDPAERLVMRLRYIEGYRWNKICTLLLPKGYSERQVYRLHGFALLKLQEV